MQLNEPAQSICLPETPGTTTARRIADLMRGACLDGLNPEAALWNGALLFAADIAGLPPGQRGYLASGNDLPGLVGIILSELGVPGERGA